MNYRSYQNLSDDIKSNINKLEKFNIDLVVGIPRSGMIPAYMISLLLNLNCTDFYSFIENRPLFKGERKLKKNGDVNILPYDYNNILLVDDSISTGKSMKEIKATIPNKLKNKIITTAIYSSESKRDDLDCFFVHLPSSMVFEWNLFNDHTLSQSCVDIDGVLCTDPTHVEDDDGENYIYFIENAIPLFLPTYKVHSLVTNRLEKYRHNTELWLKNNGVTYDNLTMLDLPSKDERQRLKIHARHKAGYYKKSDTCLFIESSFFEAKEICLLTGKDVYCVETNTMLTPNIIANIKNPVSLKKYIPQNLKKFVRSFINFLKDKKSSGVKISLVPNNSNGKMVTETISQSTQMGRQVTSHRELTAFDKIAKLSTHCRFKGCTHTGEAGCAILEALENEVLDNGSYETYLKMLQEKTHFSSTVAEKYK